jgi:hypothetical protein
MSFDELMSRAKLTEHDGEIELSAALAATLRVSVPRLDRIRAMGIDLMLDNELGNVLEALRPDWRSPSIDPEQEVPDAIYPATVIDRASWHASGRDIPVLGADISGLVLVGAQCCVAPDAPAIERELKGARDTLDWKDLGDPLAVNDAPRALPPGAFAVRPNLNNEVLERLAYALLPPASPLRAVAPSGALLLVAIPDDLSDEEDAAPEQDEEDDAAI